MGIRLALGAQRGAVQRLVVRQGMLLTAIAVALGLPAALVGAKFSSSFLYGVRPHDLVTFLTVPLLLLGYRARSLLDPGTAGVARSIRRARFDTSRWWQFSAYSENHAIDSNGSKWGLARAGGFRRPQLSE